MGDSSAHRCHSISHRQHKEENKEHNSDLPGMCSWLRMALNMLDGNIDAIFHKHGASHPTVACNVRITATQHSSNVITITGDTSHWYSHIKVIWFQPHAAPSHAGAAARGRPPKSKCAARDGYKDRVRVAASTSYMHYAYCMTWYHKNGSENPKLENNGRWRLAFTQFYWLWLHL